MANDTELRGPVEGGRSPEPQQGGATAPMPGLLGGAVAALGPAMVQRKIARRLARRADEAARSAAADGMAAVETPAAGGGGPSEAAITEVGERGLSGGGHEVPHRREMEASFGGVDFSDVRAHTDGSAATASAQLGAQAYAMGSQIAFASGSPDKATVAHELTHVVQQTRSPQYKSDGAAIDTAGEAEADRVEAAVASGGRASSVLGSAGAAPVEGAARAAASPARKRVARKEEGGGGFGMGMTFSLEGFEKSYDYTIWKAHTAWPVGIPGVNFVVDPNVKVSGKGAVKYGGKEAGNLSAQLGVFGEVGIGLSGGIPDAAEIYGTFNPGVEGAFTLTREAEHRPSPVHGSHGGAAHGHAEEHHEQGGAGAEHAEAGGARESGWNLAGAVTVKGAAKIGVALGGGIVDQAFELGSIELFKLTGVYFDANGFHRDKLGFEWGEPLKAAFEALRKAVDKARHLGKAAIEGMKDAGHAFARRGMALVPWVSSWL